MCLRAGDTPAGSRGRPSTRAPPPSSDPCAPAARPPIGPGSDDRRADAVHGRDITQVSTTRTESVFTSTGAASSHRADRSERESTRSDTPSSPTYTSNEVVNLTVHHMAYTQSAYYLDTSLYWYWFCVEHTTTSMFRFICNNNIRERYFWAGVTSAFSPRTLN